jgi:hypothetical protein
MPKIKPIVKKLFMFSITSIAISFSFAYSTSPDDKILMFIRAFCLCSWIFIAFRNGVNVGMQSLAENLLGRAEELIENLESIEDE